MNFDNAHQAVSQATSAIFERWTALVLTIEHQLGGDRQPIHRLHEATVNLAMNGNPRYSVDHLVDYFYNEFDRLETDVEDGSPEQIASLIIQIRDSALQGDFSLASQIVEKVRNGPSNGAAASVPGTNVHNHDEENNDETMEENDEGPPQTVDDDGFTSVTRGGHHR